MAAFGAFIVFIFAKHLGRMTVPIEVLDAVGLNVFAVTGASKNMEIWTWTCPGDHSRTLTGVGGGTIRDALIGRIPSVMSEGLYAIPAIVGAGITVAVMMTDHLGWLQQ